MHLEISYEWSPELVRRGTRRFIWRYAGARLVAVGLVTAGVALLLAAGYAGAVWWFIIILSLIYFAVWVAYYRTATNICREMPDRKVTVRIAPETITFETSDQTTTMKWSRIKKIWRFRDVVLLFTYDPHFYLILPSSALGEDGLRFIAEKVKAHGGQVV
ncbi:MAG: YcxB family protein [Verrucomicrobiales bacterium]|nr:YcxB family protein [Verrucomicrobiales bacterium]